MTISEFRKKLTEIEDINDLEWLLRLCGKVVEGNRSKYISFQDSNNTTIGFNENGLYILEGKDLLYYLDLKMNYDQIPAKLKVFILDNVLGLNTDDEFYKLYFKAYGYESILHEAKSPIVKEIIESFIYNRVSIVNIFVSEDYKSVTVSGRKRNNTDFESNVRGTSKEDIIELVTLLRIKPYINKKDIFESYHRPEVKKTTSVNEIMDSYNEYKESVYDESISADDKSVYDDMTIKIYDELNNSDMSLVIQSDDDFKTSGREDSYGLRLKVYNYEEELWMYTDLPESFNYIKFMDELESKRYVDLSQYSFFREEEA